MYYVEESHPAIIDKEMHTAVQFDMERRRAFAEKYNISKLDYEQLITLLQEELSVDTAAVPLEERCGIPQMKG